MYEEDKTYKIIKILFTKISTKSVSHEAFALPQILILGYWNYSNFSWFDECIYK